MTAAAAGLALAFVLSSSVPASAASYNLGSKSCSGTAWAGITFTSSGSAYASIAYGQDASVKQWSYSSTQKSHGFSARWHVASTLYLNVSNGTVTSKQAACFAASNTYY